MTTEGAPRLGASRKLQEEHGPVSALVNGWPTVASGTPLGSGHLSSWTLPHRKSHSGLWGPGWPSPSTGGCDQAICVKPCFSTQRSDLREVKEEAAWPGEHGL